MEGKKIKSVKSADLDNDAEYVERRYVACSKDRTIIM